MGFSITHCIGRYMGRYGAFPLGLARSGAITGSQRFPGSERTKRPSTVDPCSFSRIRENKPPYSEQSQKSEKKNAR